MSTAKRLPGFDKFIQDLRAAWAELPDTEARMKKGRDLLQELVNDPTMRASCKTWPDTDGGRRNLLFYEDPDYGFAINGVVHGANRKGSIHDHASMAEGKDGLFITHIPYLDVARSPTTDQSAAIG